MSITANCTHDVELVLYTVISCITLKVLPCLARPRAAAAAAAGAGGAGRAGVSAGRWQGSTEGMAAGNRTAWSCAPDVYVFVLGCC
jgi:hypothetical protein